jgi:hypothetical protein
MSMENSNSTVHDDCQHGSAAGKLFLNFKNRQVFSGTL